jgi:hypothetical protein
VTSPALVDGAPSQARARARRVPHHPVGPWASPAVPDWPSSSPHCGERYARASIGVAIAADARATFRPKMTTGCETPMCPRCDRTRPSVTASTGAKGSEACLIDGGGWVDDGLGNVAGHHRPASAASRPGNPSTTVGPGRRVTTRPNRPATRSNGRFSRQPPRDHLASTEPRPITRWSPYVRDRHAERSRSMAGLLAS